MKQVNVVATIKLDAKAARQITDISERINLIDAAGPALHEQEGDTAARQQMDALLAEAEVIYGFRLPGNVIARAPQLKWIQVMAAGVDKYLTDEILRSRVTVTNVSGIHATTIGEFVLGLMLMFVKRSDLCFQLKRQKRWQQFNPGILRGKTAGIIGLGNIGREVARLSKAFGMNVLAIRRSAHEGQKCRNVDKLFIPEHIDELLGQSDFVVLTLPLTSKTHYFIGEAQLRSISPNSYLINIARGNIIDEKALVRALEEKWIAGAGLDVFAEEPLPPDSPLWELPNVIFSPHVAGGMDNYIERTNGVFCENLERYLNKRKLLNVVNKKHGY
ncbi:MAG: D-2-hydroxyacid dehydrogenase [Dehalococcoidia bacterium]|jgi:phosphoglycerate dehydrogenase-like enzyme